MRPAVVGALHVRWGKASRGSPPKRRMVFSLFDWAVEALAMYVEQVRDWFGFAEHPALWVTERGSRISGRWLDDRFEAYRDAVGLDPKLDLHSLRHSYVSHLVEAGYPERFVTVLLSRVRGVHHVQHGAVGGMEPCRGGGYLRPSITWVPGRFDVGAAAGDARLVA